MIDFIKAYTIDKAIAARLRNTICTQVEVDHSSGEISAGEYFGKCSQFKIRVFDSGRIEMQGSLHKYYSGGMNCSDFTFEQVCQTIFSFCELLGLKPENVFLQNLEYGVNITLPYHPSVLLENIVCLPCGELFERQAGEGWKCPLFEYRHKIYNKSAQYRFGSPNLLRYEIHVDKMRKISPVKTLHDLTKPETWDMLQLSLVGHFKQIVFEDKYVEMRITKWEQKYLSEFSDKINNSRFWKKLNPLERHRHLKRVKKIQEKSMWRFSERISKQISEKVEQLKTGNNFTLQLLGENITGS
ncbi:MAG: hypothetical protein M3R17_03075 [Bacteroidota bacterium]|nr:hypothetical protein [Bacteroidota bacterium]